MTEDFYIKGFIKASILWFAGATLVGLLLAIQLYSPMFNFNSEYLNFGKLRPVHTNMIIFGFVTNFLIGTSLYVASKTCGVEIENNKLLKILFYGWQGTLSLGIFTLVLGFNSGKEYAEMEWPIDIAIGGLWALYTFLFFNILKNRRENHIFVSNWFFAAFILVVLFIYIVNNLAMPYSLFGSIPFFSGSMDAIVQWFWGHNAVGFLLTAGLIGANYYFIPKTTGCPIYSYRMSIIHFWGLVGFYTWAGAHHLIYTSVPVWIQNIGIVMSVILWIPSWVGAYNSYKSVTISSEVLKNNCTAWFFLAAIIYYALATFEGPLLAIRWFNMISHYTDWIVGHVHSGGLGWVGMSAFGVFYYFVPSLFGKKELWSKKLQVAHFYLANIGIFLYIFAMWVAGIAEGLMAFKLFSNGSLKYSFYDIMDFIDPWNLVRAIGGGCYVVGIFLMIINLYLTVKTSKAKVDDSSDELQQAVI